jgi:site-specific DNA recombinase
MDEERRDEAFEKIRALVEKIVIHPRGAYKPADIEIHGRLAAILRVSEEAARPSQSVGRMVAGVGFEPTTFRL